MNTGSSAGKKFDIWILEKSEGAVAMINWACLYRSRDEGILRFDAEPNGDAQGTMVSAGW